MMMMMMIIVVMMMVMTQWFLFLSIPLMIPLKTPRIPGLQGLHLVRRSLLPLRAEHGFQPRRNYGFPVESVVPQGLP